MILIEPILLSERPKQVILNADNFSHWQHRYTEESVLALAGTQDHIDWGPFWDIKAWIVQQADRARKESHQQILGHWTGRCRNCT